MSNLADDYEERLANELRKVGVIPGRNPDGINDDPEKAGHLIQEALRTLQIARLVASSWRDAAMRWGDLPMEGRVCAHPLSLVLGALDGETDPLELGIGPTDDAWNAIREAAAQGGK